MPVPLTSTTCSRVTPAAAIVSRMGGRMSELGVGRVISLKTTATLSGGGRRWGAGDIRKGCGGGGGGAQRVGGGPGACGLSQRLGDGAVGVGQGGRARGHED